MALAAATAGERAAAAERTWLRTPTLTGVVVMVLVVWAVGIGFLPLYDNSFLTHLATGRLLLDHGIPRHDPYSFTAAGAPWVVQSWLASLFYGVADRLWGGDGLQVLRTLLTVPLALLVFRLTRPADQLLARLGIAILVMAVGSGYWAPRPLLIGMLLLAVLLVAAEGGLDPRWAVPVMWVWVNAHGSFPLGIAAVALLAIGRRLDRQRPATELRVLQWVVVGTLLAAVNPLGPKLLTFPIHMLGRQESLQFILEWRSPDFSQAWDRVFLLQVLVAVAALARRPSWRAALPLMAFVAAALMAMRNIPVASLVMVPGMAYGLAGLGSLRGERRSPAVTMAAVAVAAVGVVIAVGGLQQPAFALHAYPEEQLAWMRGAGLLGPEARLVAPDYVGNYRELVEGTDARVFIDDRFDMYSPELVDDYATLERGGPGWDDVLAEHRATAVLWQRDSALAELLIASDDWRLVQSDDDWVVALPRS
jgi:hypothetical protein